MVVFVNEKMGVTHCACSRSSHMTQQFEVLFFVLFLYIVFGVKSLFSILHTCRPFPSLYLDTIIWEDGVSSYK